MLLQHGLHPLQGMLSHAFDIFKKPFLLQALDCCQGRGACYWVFFVNVRSTAHGFRDHGADISLFVQNIINISGALEGTLFPACPGAVDGIRWWHVFSARKKRANTGPKDCFTSDRNCVKRCTME